jgi:cytochrome c oxidase subunit 1
MSLLLECNWLGEESFRILTYYLVISGPNGVMTNDIYLSLVTIHGTIMVFFVLTAALSGTFSNLLIPLQIGARDMASGFMNMLSYWLFFSSLIMISSLFAESGPANSGWTIYPPLSALPQAIGGSGLGMTLWLVSMAIFIASSLMGSLNYIVTVINLRTEGMSMTRLPLTIWALLQLSLVFLSVLLSAVLILMKFGTSFPVHIYIAGEVLHYQGGSPVLFEHLFWFLGHPEVYIVLLPALASEVIATNARKPIFGYRAMIIDYCHWFSRLLCGAHHMFVSGMNPFWFSILLTTLLIYSFRFGFISLLFITKDWFDRYYFG